MRLLKLATLGLFSLLSACGSSDATGGGTGGSAGASGAGASGAGASGAGASGAGSGGTAGSGRAWRCDQAQSACSCNTYPGTTLEDNCTSKPSCCMLYSVGGVSIDTCICNDLTGTGETCAQLASQVQGTVVTTCPPP